MINSLDSRDEEFSIDTIEDIITRFNTESKQIVVETINEAIAPFDEKEIITKKTRDCRAKS